MTKFVKCKPSDWQVLQRLSTDTFRLAFEAKNEKEDMEQYLKEAFADHQVQQELKHPFSSFYFLFADSQLAGYFKLNTKDAQTEFIDQGMELERIYLLPDFQRRGLGQEIMDFVHQLATEAAVATLWLGVWEENKAAIKFYERNGFVTFSKHAFMLGQDRQIDLLMRKQL